MAPTIDFSWTAVRKCYRARFAYIAALCPALVLLRNGSSFSYRHSDGRYGRRRRACAPEVGARSGAGRVDQGRRPAHPRGRRLRGQARQVCTRVLKPPVSARRRPGVGRAFQHALAVLPRHHAVAKRPEHGLPPLGPVVGMRPERLHACQRSGCAAGRLPSPRSSRL